MTADEPAAAIYHIATREDWERQRGADRYTAPSLATEGFIHASTGEQVLATANRLFRGRQDLLLLTLDPAGLDTEVRYEDLYGEGQAFPHVYGPIPRAAILAVRPLVPEADGAFRALPQ